MVEAGSNNFGSFVMKNAQLIITAIAFICGIYVQYEVNTMKIEQLERELAQVRFQTDQHYAKLDDMKLDKAVFEATMKQFTEMSSDIRDIRNRLYQDKK